MEITTDCTVSVSKGVFVFQNGYKKHKQSKKKSKPIFEKLFTNEDWYTTYKTNLNNIESQIKDLHSRTYSVLMNDIVAYITSCHNDSETMAIENIIPSATLLTGVNQPDHVSQFGTLTEKLRDEVTPHVAMVSSQEAPSLKHLVENVVWQLLHENQGMAVSDCEDMEEDITSQRKLKKTQCTMKTLNHWYHNKYNNASPKKKRTVSSRSLVIIIPDFESYSSNILQDFVMIASSYISSLPLVLVFGVATSVSALHKSFPYHVSSKLLIKVFHSHSSPVYLNQVLEEIFLTHTSPLHLSGKAFQLLTDVFLFYDFSVTGLLQSIKYCMMDHYYGDNVKALCCEREKLKEIITNLSSENLDDLKKLMSFRPYVESQDYKTQIKLLEDDGFLRKALLREMQRLHDYLYSFYLCIRLLHIFVKDLPRNLLGKSIRELYTKCSVENVVETQPFKECIQLLKFQSQVKISETINSALKLVNSSLNTSSPMKPLRSTPTKNNLNNVTFNTELGEQFMKSVRIHLTLFLRQIENSNTECGVTTESREDTDTENTPGSRYKLKEKLLQATRLDRIQSEFEMIRSRFVSYLEEMFGKGLEPPYSMPFYEIFFFNDVASVKKQIVGSPRGALHTALSNPVHYLQCMCCHLPTLESMVDTLPDVCLAYKLHRECGKHINLYDWLQAFAAVLRPDQDDDQRNQDASIHIRFTRAVAELQFLGFIKASKRKTDHVMRLTW